jgi:hypothetical protein
MRNRSVVARGMMQLALVAAALCARPLLAQETRPGGMRFPEEHAEEGSAGDPDKKASDLTESVARQLPHAGSPDVSIPRRNLIDDHLFGAMARDKIPHASLANDYEFVRRIYIDMTGRIPSTEQLTKFIDDQSPDKRDRLIDELLDSQAWVDNWGYWYGDLFRNCANRIGNAATKHFDAWFRQCLKEDRPYNEIVTEMLTVSAPNTGWLPDAAPSGFLTRSHVAGVTM